MIDYVSEKYENIHTRSLPSIIWWGCSWEIIGFWRKVQAECRRGKIHMFAYLIG